MILHFSTAYRYCLLFGSVALALGYPAFADQEESATVTLGPDRTVASGSTVTLAAEIGGNCTNISSAYVYWMERNSKGDWSAFQSGNASNTTYSFTASVSREIKIQFHCPLGSGGIFTSELVAEDTIRVDIGPWTVNPPRKSGGWWGISQSEYMEREARSLFSNPDKLKDVRLDLMLRQQDRSPLMQFEWNYLGGEKMVTYLFEYSTDKAFSRKTVLETTERWANVIEWQLAPSGVHFFRLRARFGDSYTPYSNVIRFFSEDPLPNMPKNENCLPDFSDAAEGKSTPVEPGVPPWNDCPACQGISFDDAF